MAAVTFNSTSDIRCLDQSAIAAHPIYGSRPVLRGRFHQLGAVAAGPIGLHLARTTPGSARAAVAIYALTAIAMFSTSAAYHRLAQSVEARFWMRRADHALIFVHVAGATTPIAVIGVGGAVGVSLLVVAWTGAAVGAAGKLTRLTADHDPCRWLFPVLGVLPLVSLPWLIGTVGTQGGMLLVASVATYAVGAVCFFKKSPDPIPMIFGYHEVWHVFTLVGAGFQLALTVQLVAVA